MIANTDYAEKIEVVDEDDSLVTYQRIGANLWKITTKHGTGSCSSAEVLAEVAKAIFP